MRYLWIPSLICVLTACGGGGSEETNTSNPNNPNPTTTPTQTGAVLTAAFDRQQGLVTLEWKDPLISELGYKVEKKVVSATTAASSEWVLVEDIPAYTGQGQTIKWQKHLTEQTEYRVIIKLADQDRVLLTSSNQQSLIVNPNIQAAIQLSTAEPLRNNVNLSVQATGFTPKSVIYYNDTLRIGDSKTLPNFLFNWNISSLTDGTHQLMAKVESSTDSFIVVNKTIDVDNPNISLAIQSVLPENNKVTVRTKATSTNGGIKQVNLFVDNQAMGGSLSVPTCVANTTCPTDSYEWLLDVTSLKIGNHELKIIAEDNNGETIQKTSSFYKNINASLNVNSALDYQIIGNRLLITGSMNDDEEDNPLLKVYLRNIEIYRTNNKDFTIDIDLTTLGLVSGSYSLYFEMTPKTGQQVTITRQINYQPDNANFKVNLIETLGSQANLKGVYQQDLLFAYNDNLNVYLYDTTTKNKQFIVKPNSLDQIKSISEKGVLLNGDDKDNKTIKQHVYLWNNGSLKDLSELSGTGLLFETPLLFSTLKNSWGAWKLNTGSYILYNLDTQEKHNINLPSYATLFGHERFDLYPSANGCKLYTWAKTANSFYDLLEYDTETQKMTRLTNNSALNVYPQVGTNRIAWVQAQDGQSGVYTLVAAPISNPLSQQTISTVMSQFWLKDDLLMWEETVSGQKTIKVNNGINQYTLPMVNVQIQAIENGKIIYNKDDKTWLWQPSQAPEQLFGFSMRQVKLSSQTNKLYFTTGVSNHLYWTQLP